jgi:hypothetical protein
MSNASEKTIYENYVSHYPYNITPCRYKKSAGIEIEIEVSGISYTEFEIPKELHKFWKVVAEDSVRNGLEFVLSKPLFIGENFEGQNKQLNKAVDALYDFFEEKDSNIVTSLRTGIHIHLNVQKLTETEILDFLHKYYLIEPALTNIEGKHREGNCFCLRYKDSEYILQSLLHYYEQNPKVFSCLDIQTFKYSSLNLAPILYLGSVEFRFMNTTKDRDRLKFWLSCLSGLLYGDNSDVKSVLTSTQECGYLEDMLLLVLPDYQVEYLMQRISSPQEVLTACKENIYPLLYYYKEFERIRKEEGNEYGINIETEEYI